MVCNIQKSSAKRKILATGGVIEIYCYRFTTRTVTGSSGANGLSSIQWIMICTHQNSSLK